MNTNANRFRLEEGRLKAYSSPEIITITLDRDISLQMQSNPIDGPGESMNHIGCAKQPEPYYTS